MAASHAAQTGSAARAAAAIFPPSPSADSFCGMRVLLAVVVAMLALPATAAASGKQVAIFFYPWYGTPAHDAEWIHWQQRGATPPTSIASAFYPARGV